MKLPRLSGTEWRLAALLAAVAAAQIWLVHDMRFLASGLFGGDHAYQLACIRSIAASLNPMASCNVTGALPGYFPLYGTLVAYFARITQMDPLRAMFVTAVLFRLLSAFVVYRVFARLYGRSTGLVIACLWSALHPELIFKYTEFTTGILVPLYFLALHRYLERPGSGRAALLGLAIAVLGYSHSVAFMGGVAIAALAILAALFWRSGPRGAGREALTMLRHLPIFAGCGLLALGYWWRPIFVYHGRTSLHYAEWNSGDFSDLAQRLGWAGRTLLAEFSFASGPAVVLTLLIAAGLAVVLAAPGRRRHAPALTIVAVTFVWMFHYFATVPALGTHFVPRYVQWMLWGFARLFLPAIAIAALFGRTGRQTTSAIQVAALLLALIAVFRQTAEIHASPDMQAARTEQDPGIRALTRWTTEHLAPEDVALSTNELSFAWGAITGRKTVVSRRAQNDAFIDMDIRNLDAARMLYGRDDTLRTRLLEKYRVKYVFWASNWFASEYAVRPPADTLTFDPFMWFRSDAYDAEAEKAGLEIFHDLTWVDPTLRGPEYPQFDLTYVTHRNYGPSYPWRDDLQRRLEVAWVYPDAQRPRLAVLRVKR